MIYIGIDVGKKGAIAFVGDESGTVTSQPLDGTQVDESRMAELLRGLNRMSKCKAYIEKAHAMPKQGVTSMFSFGCLYGLWRGMLTALDIDYEIVTPKKWQDAMLAGESKTDGTKVASIRVAKRMFQGISLLPTERCRKPSDGMADALLIAEYGRRLHSGQTLKQGD